MVIKENRNGVNFVSVSPWIRQSRSTLIRQVALYNIYNINSISFSNVRLLEIKSGLIVDGNGTYRMQFT